MKEHSSLRGNSVLILWPLTGEVNDTDYLFIVDGIYWGASEHFVHKRKEQWWTNDRVMAGQGSLMHVRSECWLLTLTDFSDREVPEHTVCHSLHVCCLSMGLHRRRLVVLEVTTYIRIEIFYHRMKVITSYKKEGWIDHEKGVPVIIHWSNGHLVNTDLNICELF